MSSKLLNVINLSGKPYIQGACVIRALLATISPNATNFSMKFTKPQHFTPILHYTVERTRVENATVVGSYILDGHQYFFHLLDSDIPCKTIDFDGDAVQSRIVKIEDTWHLDLQGEDPQICWNEVARKTNLAYFREHYPGTNDKRMILAGVDYLSLQFLAEPAISVGLSYSFDIIKERCIRRNAFYNGKIVGTRHSIYG